MRVKAATNCTLVISFFGTLESLCCFFTASAKQEAKFHLVQLKAGKQTQMPKSISDTRWAARANVVMHINDNIEAYIEAIESLMYQRLKSSLTLEEGGNLEEGNFHLMSQMRPLVMQSNILKLMYTTPYWRISYLTYTLGSVTPQLEHLIASYSLTL